MCDKLSTFPSLPRRTYWQGRTSVVTQIGEQKYIRKRKGAGGMKGISTSAEQVAVWINSFSVCAHLNIAMEYLYRDAGDVENPLSGVDKDKNNKHKEEGQGRRKLVCP